VGSWLHGVAYRLAVKAKRTAGRRRQRELQAGAAAAAALPADLAWRELQAMLDEEVRRLPEKYRAPFVLCCLEGRSRKGAAAELGWKAGTVSSRVAQARRLLQERLARRGVTLSAALCAGTLWQQSAAAAVPAGLVRATLAAVARLASAPSWFASGVLAAMGLTRLKLAALLTAVLLLAAGALASRVGDPGEPAPAQGTPPVARGPAEVPPRTDGFGDPLPEGAVARVGTIRLRHGSLITALTFSPEGTRSPRPV
jgi:hypothetical protein